MIISCWKTCSSGFAMRLDHATLKCSPQSLCRVSSCWTKGGRQAPQPRQGELIVKPWCKIELHFHDPQTGHSYVALSSLELGTESNGRACMRQDFHISSRTPRDLKRCQAQALNSKQHCRVIDQVAWMPTACPNLPWHRLAADKWGMLGRP